MNNQLFELHLSIALQAPFLVQGSEPAGIGLDAVVQRNADGLPIIPCTLLVGKLKEVWANNGHKESAEKWFGAEARNNDERNFDPQPGLLVETDLTLTTTLQNENSSIIHRVSIDAQTGSAKPGALLMIEQPWRIGEQVSFQGIWFVIANQKDAERLADFLQKTIAWIGQLGAQASVGFGKITNVSVSAIPVKPAAAPLRSSRLYYRMTSPYPVLVPRVGGAYDTLFEGASTIPGAAIKAAIAMTMNALNSKKLRQPIGNGFDEVICSHAFPVKAETKGQGVQATQQPNRIRHSHLPLSLVKVKAGSSSSSQREPNFYDVRVLSEPHMIDGEVPVFQIDWKDADSEALAKKLPELVEGPTKKHLRVRTMMEDGTSKEAALFSHESVSSDLGWYGFIDLGAVKTDVATQIQNALSNTVLYLGKLKTPVNFEVLSDASAVWKQAWVDSDSVESIAVGSLVTVCLNTEALLNPLEEIKNDDAYSLTNAYRKYWASVSTDGLELSHFFASQQLAGGVFAANYRQKKLGQYRPWFVTKAGSTFVLKVKTAEGLALLKRWAKIGLPLSDAVKHYYGSDWQTNPYGPENGYGEIIVNPEFKNLPKLTKHEPIQELETNPALKES
jgi:hypothetical protein